MGWDGRCTGYRAQYREGGRDIPSRALMGFTGGGQEESGLV